MKVIFVYISLIVASGLLFTNIYTSIVDATSWGGDFPASVQTARDYYAHVNPGDFFRIFSPMNQLLAVIAVILFWKRSRQVRIFLCVALILYVAADAFTFAYFYPRNEIIFMSDISQATTIRTALSEWQSMNWLRSLVAAAGIAFTCLALFRINSSPQLQAKTL